MEQGIEPRVSFGQIRRNNWFFLIIASAWILHFAAKAVIGFFDFFEPMFPIWAI